MRRLTVVLLAGMAVLALAGGAWGASKISGKEIKTGTITGKQVKNHSLRPKDFRGSVRGPRGKRGRTGPQGSQGPQGAQGQQGPQGPAGPVAAGKIVTAEATGSVAPGDINTVEAYCPSGTTALSGGSSVISGNAVVFIDTDYNFGVGWVIGVDNSNDSVSADVTSRVKCAPTGKAAIASVSGKRRALRKAGARDVARQIARHRG